MSEFRSGERYRLGLVLQRGELVVDDWTGVEVELTETVVGEFEDGLWLCRWRGSARMIVSVQRLRASARLRDLPQ